MYKIEDIKNTIICGDALEILKEFPGEFVDCIITSPPYKNSYEGIGISRGTKKAKFHYTIDVGEPLYLIEDVSSLLIKILKPEGTFLLNLGFNKDSGALRPFYIVERLLRQGWFCCDSIIWHKKNPIPNTANQLTNAFEYIFVLTKQPFYKLSTTDKKYIHNVWEFSISSEDFDHNAMFPAELPKRCIEIFTKRGDIILDPFIGSGTTAVVAKKLGRQFIGIELNPKYTEMANKRIEEECGNLF